MNINGIQAGLGPVAVEIEKAKRRNGEGRTKPVSRKRLDSVTISDEARALAAQLKEGGLSPERIGEIRRWIAEGRYNEPDVAEEVAWRLIEQGVV